MTPRRLLTITLGLGCGLALMNAAFIGGVRYFATERAVSFLDQPPVETLLADHEAATARDHAAVPFAEIAPFDDEAHSWANVFSGFASGGATVFDANGDGLLDVYFARDGQNWTRASDADAVLEDKPRFMANTLYLNQGNDADGRPIYARLDELARANDEHTEAELLVEDYLYPRGGPEDATERLGRNSTVSLAADFNGDGRMDLMVGNSTFGSFWSSPETQRVLNRFVDPMGREARSAKSPLSSLINHFVHDYAPVDGTERTRESARGIEPEGANSLYLNLGDADGDGLPEWADVSREAGVEGKRATVSLIAADIDLDGDLDIYEANTMDPDFWPGGSTGWAGAANALYVSQLADAGTFAFSDEAGALGVDGMFDEDYAHPPIHRVRKVPYLPLEYSIAFLHWETYLPPLLTINGDTAEDGEISWASVFQDVNEDGYPDIWVANDLGTLRLYLNDGGQRFVDTPHARYERTGMWMTLAPGDLNGDGHEDLAVGNMGGNMLNHAFVVPDFYAMTDPVITDSMAFRTLAMDEHDPTHALIDGADFTQDLAHSITHSSVLPPDATLPNNVRQSWITELDVPPFNPDSLDPYEFAWGMTTLDVQNDGRLDLYFIGCLYSRGGGLFPVMGTDPGRLLVNETAPGGELAMVDLTAEHQLFDIKELQYDRLEDEGYIYRKSPLQNWRKRDTVNSYDRSTWVAQGPGIQERMTNHDLIQTADNGRAAVGADLNGDGFADVLITNQGGYDSRSSENKNLKAMIDGRPQVVPPPDHNYPTLTNFEPGTTRVFLNQYTDNRWIKVRLVDDEGLNRDAVGAVVVVNEQWTQHKRAGSGGFVGNVAADLLFGMGQEAASEVAVTWPDAARTVTTVPLDAVGEGTVTVYRSGAIEWAPWGDGAALD